MLKKISRDEAIDATGGERSVYMLYEICGGHTLDDIRAADGFVMEVPDQEPNKCLLEAVGLAMKQDPEKVKSEIKSEISSGKSEILSEKVKTPKEAIQEAVAVSKEIENMQRSEKQTKKAVKTDRGKICALYKAGWPIKKIADEIGCADQTVRNNLIAEGLYETKKEAR